MSHTSKIFEEAPVLVQNKNGFDLSHLHVGSAKCGQLVPVLTKLLPPNSDFTLGINMEVNLPPLATTFYGRVDAIVEGFVIPCSILYGGWKQFISNQQSTMFPNSQSGLASDNANVSSDGEQIIESRDPMSWGGRVGGYALPVLSFYWDGSSSTEEFMQALDSNDNLLDYFGVHPDTFGQSDDYGMIVNMLPFLAYHLIHDVYYRNKQITRTYFAVNPNVTNSAYNAKNVSLVWHSFYTRSTVAGTSNGTFGATVGTESKFPDGTWIWHTRQRNYARDYFTAAVPSPQQGTAARLVFNTVDNADSGFSIGALRAVNSLAKFLETNNLSGDYSDMMRNRWGARPIDADFDEPYYLGRVIVPVYQKSVYQQDNSAAVGAVNPFAQQGATATKAANGSFVGEGSITNKFHNSTWAYVMCLFSLVPHAMYGWGANRELFMKFIGDFPAPEFQSIGYEEIYSSELYINPTLSGSVMDPSVDTTFGYIPRYSRFKYMDDQVSGELRPGRTLDSFVLQRDFSSQPQLSTSFLEIGQSDLDSVLAVSTQSMNLTCWFEIYFEFKVAMPLADFCIPTLGDLRDVHTIKAPVGGSRL